MMFSASIVKTPPDELWERIWLSGLWAAKTFMGGGMVWVYVCDWMLTYWRCRRVMTVRRGEVMEVRS